MSTEAQKRAYARYLKKLKQVLVRLNVETDADIIKKLGSVTNKNSYIKDLIRRDISGA